VKCVHLELELRSRERLTWRLLSSRSCSTCSGASEAAQSTEPRTEPPSAKSESPIARLLPRAPRASLSYAARGVADGATAEGLLPLCQRFALIALGAGTATASLASPVQFRAVEDRCAAVVAVVVLRFSPPPAASPPPPPRPPRPARPRPSRPRPPLRPLARPGGVPRPPALPRGEHCDRQIGIAFFLPAPAVVVGGVSPGPAPPARRLSVWRQRGCAAPL